MHKIITWNIRHGGGTRTDNILHSISNHNADTVILTEFRNNKSGIKIITRLAGEVGSTG